MPSSELVVDVAGAGLPGLAHGGYVAGLLTVAIGADSSCVKLRRPVPSGRALRLVRTAPAQVELHDDAGPLAIAVEADVALRVQQPVAPADAAAASQRCPGPGRHPFPLCMCCGPDHPAGLGISPGPVAGRGVVAAHWVPAAQHADDRGNVRPELVCAALDCPQLWALMFHAPPATPDRVVTAMLETRLEHRVVAGEPHVVVGWPLGRDGRRWVAGAAIFGPRGELCAAGRQAAAVVAGWGVPLGRDGWAPAAVAVG